MFKRLLIILLIVLLLAASVLVVLALVDSSALAAASDVANVTYPAADGTTLVGFLAMPETPNGAAVLMVHEWWGLNAEIVEMAELLAEEGYVVLAPDTYRGRVATTVPGALTLRLSAPPDRVDSDMQAAHDFLLTIDGVDPARIGVMGFCYGGGVALRHAVNNPAIAATVNLYGATIDDPAAFGALLTTGGPVLGIFGEVDQQIPIREVERFEAALEQAGINHVVTIYPGVGHAFVDPAGIAAGGPAADAWAQILAFFAAHLGGEVDPVG